MRTRLVGGNWKMHKDPVEARSYFDIFRPLVERSAHCEIVICPTFLDIENAVDATRGSSIQIGAQDLYWSSEGAFTGEVSGPMVKASGCSHVIVGHSERRRCFGETDEIVGKKAAAALDAGLIPIVCIGESFEKDANAVLTLQFRGGIAGLSDIQFARIVIAYEPVWAIGNGRTATLEVAAEAHRFIREQAKLHFGADAAAQARIIYGGSVETNNAESLLASPEIDGFLVGGASLNPVSFATLVNLRTWN